MSERLKHIGRLREKEIAAKNLSLRMKGLVKSIRELLDPFEALEKLQADVAATQAVELENCRIEYIGLLDEIKAIKNYLGE